MRNLMPVFVGLLALAGNSIAAVTSVCNRTEPVKVVLEGLLKKTCESINESDLLTLTRVDVSERRIEKYHPDDFSGLGNLEVLNIRSNPAPELPEGLLRDQVRLKTIVIIGAGLRHLPDDFPAYRPKRPGYRECSPGVGPYNSVSNNCC